MISTISNNETPGEKELEKERKRIEESDELITADQELIEELDSRLVYDDVDELRHAQVLKYVRLIAERSDAHGVPLQATRESKELVRTFLSWLEEGEYEGEKQTYTFGEKSKTHYRSALPKFGEGTR